MIKLLVTLDGQRRALGRKPSPIDCFRCGICCERYQPPATEKEIKAISHKLGMTPDEFILKYAQRAPIKEGYLLRRTVRGCVFLTTDESELASCKIYDVRPRACREWQASLSRMECREGLSKLKPTGTLPNRTYSSKTALKRPGRASSSK